MTILRAVLASLLFIVVLEITGLWMLININYDILILVENYRFVNGLLELVIVLLFMWKITDLRSAFKSRFSYGYLLAAILLGITFPFFQGILNIIYYLDFDINLFAVNWNFENLLDLNVIASILLIPVSEELFFRQYVQNGLHENYSAAKSIIITSLLFALIHLPFVLLYFNPENFTFHQAYTVFFGGILLGILYHKTRSLWPPLIMHMTWNLIVSVMQ